MDQGQQGDLNVSHWRSITVYHYTLLQRSVTLNHSWTSCCVWRDGGQREWGNYKYKHYIHDNIILLLFIFFIVNKHLNYDLNWIKKPDFSRILYLFLLVWFLQFNCYYSIIFSILVLLLLGVIVHSVDGPLDGLAKCPWCALELPVDMWYIKCNNATIIIMIIIIVNIIIIIIIILLIRLSPTFHPLHMRVN